MLLEIAGVLNQPQLDKLLGIVEQARFVDGRNSAGMALKAGDEMRSGRLLSIFGRRQRNETLPKRRRRGPLPLQPSKASNIAQIFCWLHGCIDCCVLCLPR